MLSDSPAAHIRNMLLSFIKQKQQPNALSETTLHKADSCQTTIKETSHTVGLYFNFSPQNEDPFSFHLTVPKKRVVIICHWTIPVQIHDGQFVNRKIFCTMEFQDNQTTITRNRQIVMNYPARLQHALSLLTGAHGTVQEMNITLH